PVRGHSRGTDDGPAEIAGREHYSSKPFRCVRGLICIHQLINGRNIGQLWIALGPALGQGTNKSVLNPRPGRLTPHTDRNCSSAALHLSFLNRQVHISATAVTNYHLKFNPEPLLEELR